MGLLNSALGGRRYTAEAGRLSVVEAGAAGADLAEAAIRAVAGLAGLAVEILAAAEREEAGEESRDQGLRDQGLAIGTVGSRN